MSFSWTDLEDTVEKLNDDLHNKQEAITQLKHENEKLHKLVHDKEEQLKKW